TWSSRGGRATAGRRRARWRRAGRPPCHELCELVRGRQIVLRSSQRVAEGRRDVRARIGEAHGIAVGLHGALLRAEAARAGFGSLGSSEEGGNAARITLLAA